MKEFIVKEKFVGERLDKFLTEQTKQTRSQIKKAILNGDVLVNGKRAKVHQFLKSKDTVIIQKSILNLIQDKNQKYISKIKNQKLHTSYLAYLFNWRKPLLSQKTRLRPKILHKTKDYIILEKPAGLLVHATESSTEPTLVDWLVKKFPKIRKVSDSISLQKDDQTFRPGIVHRLDKDVSGIMLIARNQNSFEYYKQQFKLQKIHKKYTALIHGQIEQDHDTIEFEISRSAKGGRMASHPKESGKGRQALTEFKVLKRFKKTTLVEITLHTGRTNQIRVHFMAIGHPVVGDRAYGIGSYNNRFTERFELKRQFLHAYRLVFVDMEGEKIDIKTKLPDDLEAVLNQIQ